MAGQVDTNYVKSVFGILKILEFICLVIAWACLIDYNGGVRGLHSRNSFFLGVNIAAWVFVIVWFIGYLFMICNQIKLSNQMLIYGFVHLAWFVLLLISGALVADFASRLYCKAWWHNCELYECAAAFGLISSFLFLIDGILHIKQRNVISVASGGASSGGSGGRVVTKRTVVKTTTKTVR